MEQKNGAGMCACDCTACRCMHGRRSHRWVIIVLGVVIIFWIGMKLGEIKGFMMSQYGFNGREGGWMMMDDRYEYNSAPNERIRPDASAPESAPTTTPTTAPATR